MDDVTSGEKLLKSIYESIRNSPHWEKSLLIITYDEHGGFYDHVVPPATVHPGDSITEPGNNHNNFDFRQLGLRVPTIIVSPFVAKGTIDHTLYDHTSALATIEKLFKLGSLTKRDGGAESLNHLFKLDAPRADAPAILPSPAVSGYVHKEKSRNSVESRLSELLEGLVSFFRPESVDPSLRGFHHVALLRDLQDSPENEKEKITGRFLRHKKYNAVRYMQRIREEAVAKEAHA
jgi:phospholipase C